LLAADLLSAQRAKDALLAPTRTEHHDAGWNMVGCGPIAMTMTFEVDGSPKALGNNELAPDPLLHVDNHDGNCGTASDTGSETTLPQNEDGSWDLAANRAYWIWCNGDTTLHFKQRQVEEAPPPVPLSAPPAFTATGQIAAEGSGGRGPRRRERGRDLGRYRHVENAEAI